MTEDKIELTHLTVQDSLVGVMLGAMISDSVKDGKEADYINFFVSHLPVFAGYDKKRIPALMELFSGTIKVEGDYSVYKKMVLKKLPQELHNLAFLLANVVSVSDHQFNFDEYGFLNILEEGLKVDPDIANKIKLVAQIYNTQ